jgi:MFS transporter, ACS family, glucarate transporter
MMNPPAGKAPTRVRYGVLIFVCTLAMITYLDRAAFPNVQGSVLASLGMNDISQLKVALTAFQLAYALFEIPTGWLGDVFGPRKTLIRIVLWWSLFIALTGLVGRVTGVIAFGYTVPEFTLYGFWMLVAVRFMFGIGEAGAFPNIARALYNWFPLSERGRASGTVWMSARLMGGLTPSIMTILLYQLGLNWRALFLVFGLVGVVWCIAFSFWFRNSPEEKASVNDAERELIRGERGPTEVHGGIPWRKILTNRSVWALCLTYIAGNYGWYFSLNYLPAFLEDQYGVSQRSMVGSLYKGGPLLLGMVGCLAGGWLTDQFIRRTGDRKWGRRIYGAVGYGLTGVCMLTLLTISGEARFAWVFAAVIALSGFTNDLTMASSWAACQDVGKRYSAIVSGCMNMIGNLGGALTTYATGWVLEMAIARRAATGTATIVVNHCILFVDSNPGHDPALSELIAQFMSKAAKTIASRPGWELNFALYGVVYLAAVGCWLMLDVTKPVDQSDVHAA